MAIINTPPISITDPPIRPNDTGEAVKQLNDFLQSLPEEQQRQNFLADFGKSYSLTDGNHYNTFSVEAGKALYDFQISHKKQIIDLGNLSEQQFQKEINIVSYLTWNIILQVQGKSPSTQEKNVPEKKDDSVEEQNKNLQPVENKLKDPDSAINNPQATYYVKTKDPNNRLALRKAPAYEEVSKESSEDNDKKGILVAMMPNNTLVNVIQFGVGFNCQWSQVEVVDNNSLFDKAKELQKTIPLYCYSEFLQPLRKTDPILPISCEEECSEITDPTYERTSLFPLWQTLDSCEPFFDKETCAYYITVNLEDTSTDDVRIEGQTNNALIRGIRYLFEFYDKQFDDELVDRYYQSGIPTVIESYLDERPNSPMQFLIKFPSKYFNSIPQRTDFLEDIPNVENGTIPDGWRVLTFNYSDIPEIVKNLSNIIQEYDQDLSKWDGEVVDYDFFTEAERVRWFEGVLDWIIEKNVLTPEENDSFEIGFKSPCFSLAYILLTRDGVSSPLRIGFNCFLKKEPIKYSRTMGYLYYHKDIIDDYFKERKAWTDFIYSYSCPIPEIKPSKQSSPNKKKDVVSKPNQLFKTTKEKIEEDKRIFDINYKKQKLKETKKKRRFVGDPILDCNNVEFLLNKINSVDDLYDQLLNKIDVGSISSFLISCVASRFGAKELFALMCKFALRKLGYDKLQLVLNFFNDEVTTKIQNYSEQLRLKNIYNESEILRKSIEFSASDDEICKALYDFDPELIAFNLKNILFSFKNIYLSLFDLGFTEDILSDIVDAIIIAIKSALSALLISLVKDMLRSVCELCQPITGDKSQKYGDTKINDSIPRGKNKNIYKDFGIEPTNENENFVNDTLDDVSSILLPSEICSLLNGTAPISLLNIVFKYIEKKFPHMLKYIPNTSSLKNFFIHIGNNMDVDMCRNLEEINKLDRERVIQPDQNDLCLDLEGDLRRSLLEGRMSPKQLDQQIQKIKDRDKEKLEKLVNLLDGTIFSDIPQIPNDKNCKEQNNNKNVFAQEHPSVLRMNEKIIENIFNSVYTSFNYDLSNFIYAIINNGKDQVLQFDLERAKRSINASRKQLKDLEGDKDILVSDPLGIGEDRGEDKKTTKDAFIAEEIRNILSSTSNRHKFDQKDNNNSIAVYDFVGQVQLSEGMKQIINQLGVGNNEINIEKLYPNQECDEEVFKLSSNTLIRYYLPPYSDNKDFKDSYNILINDDSLKKIITINGNNPLNSDIRDFASKYMKTIEKDISLQQNLFANYVVDIWNKAIDIKSKDSITNKSLDFYKLFRDDIFHEITLSSFNTLSLIIANSKLFNMSDFENVKFIENPSEDGYGNNLCPPNNDKNLLNINNIKDIVKDKNDKLSKQCDNLIANSINKKFSSVEKSNLAGIIETITREYVVEYLLRGMFSFSEFNISDLITQDSIIKYIMEKIKDDMRNKSHGFYEDFSLRTKEYILERGVDLDNDILKNELHPKNISGEAFVEFSIKEQLNNVSGQLNDIVGVDIDDLNHKIFNSPEQEINQEELLEKQRVTLIDDDVEDVPREERKVLKGVNQIKQEFDVRINKGNRIYFEKYVRLVNEYGNLVNRVMSVEEFANLGESIKEDENYCGKYSIRLVYEIAINDKVTKVMNSIGLNPNIVKNERSYNYQGRYVFPLVVIESENLCSRKDFYNGYVDEKELIKQLKEKMFTLPEYKFLFNFIFSLERSLTIISLYSILLMGKSVKNIDSAFESSKKLLRQLFRMVQPVGKDWWKFEDPESGTNEELLAKRNNSITTSGCGVFSSMAAMTLNIIIKKVSEVTDPSYRLLKLLFDVGLADLQWKDIWRVAPINLFPFSPIAGPPIGPAGIISLSIPLLSGEKKQKEKIEREKQAKKEGENSSISKSCKNDNNK